MPERQTFLLYPIGQMTRKQKHELVGALLACPTMSNRNIRDTVVNNLPGYIEDNIQRSSVDRADVDHIVTTCLNYRGGIEELIEIVRFYEDDSIRMREVDKVWSRISASVATGETSRKEVTGTDGRRTRKQVWRVVLVLGVVFIIAGLIFLSQSAATVRDGIEEWWRGVRVTPMPTVAIPGIDRIEVWMNGDQLNLDQLPSLTSGQAVELEVIVIDTNGKEYTSDDIVCRWSVVPLGDKDIGIDTELCKTYYMPSQGYSQQAVGLEVEGLEQQFEPGDPTSMQFDIVK